MIVRDSQRVLEKRNSFYNRANSHKIQRSFNDKIIFQMTEIHYSPYYCKNEWSS